MYGWEKKKQVDVYVDVDIYRIIKKAQKRFLKVSINYSGRNKYRI